MATNPCNSGYTMDGPDNADVSSSLSSKPKSVHRPDHKPLTIHTDNQARDQIPNFIPAKELKDSILSFLATSSGESLGCAIAALIAATYILLGRIGLVLIGLVLGVLLHASWEGGNNESSVDVPYSRNPGKRKELALDLANRLLDWPRRKPTEGQDSDNNDSRQKTINKGCATSLDYSAFGPMTSAALRSITDAAIKDYVIYWYEPILPSESTFPLSCRVTLTDFITSVTSHLLNKRPADTFLQFLINTSSVLIVFMNELSAAFQVSGEAKSPKQAITQYLQQYPDSSLANILEDHQQRTKLNMVADDILSGFLSPNAYDCTPVRNFLREVLAGVIFESTISNLSRPEFINTWIIHIFSEGESEIMNAIDAGVEGARNQGVTTSKSSVDVRNSSLGSVDNPGPSSQIPSKPDQQLNNIDKATFDALKETTRLSNVIAVQDAQAHNTQQGANTSSVAGTCSRESCNAAFVPSTPNVAQGPSNRQTEDFKADSNDQPQDTYELYAKEPVLSTHSSQTPSQAPVNSPISAGKSDGTSLTLYGAYVSVDDGSQSSDQGAIRSKPTSDYLLQIEPVPSRCTGWMVFRKYADFESLHETLETISRLNKIKSFTDKHPILPPWKGQAKQPLARNLERYLQDALQHEALAESNRMKRFLEKDTRLGHQSVNSSTKSGSLLPSQASFENMGKGFLDALTSAPKGFAGGSKNVISGVTGALGNVAASSRRTPSSFPVENNQDLKDPFNFTPDQVECSRSPRPLPKLDTNTQEDSSSSPFGETRASPAIETHCDDSSLASGVGVLNDTYCNPSLYDSRKSSLSVGKQSTADVQPYESDIDSQKFSGPCDDPINKKCNESAGLPSPDCGPAETPSYPSQTGADAVRRSNHSITNEETQIAIELIFAVINELYSMSSAWNIRKTLLNAAKSYILRPGSPNLEMIRASLQDSIIDPQTSDEALAQYLTNLRENAFPTEDELKAWPPSPSETEKEHLRDAARKVFVQRGIPQTLMSVMGAAASREALGKIFDCLQVETVARGLAFSLLMQALRAVIL